MVACIQCGDAINADENLCGVCGSRPDRVGSSSSPDVTENVQHDTYPAGMKDVPNQERPTSMSSQRGTGELNEDSEFASRTSRTGEAPSRRRKPKAREAGTVLTHRHEI